MKNQHFKKSPRQIKFRQEVKLEFLKYSLAKNEKKKTFKNYTT